MRGVGVSIHAFRGEGDQAALPAFRSVRFVSIHAFRGEGDIVPVGYRRKRQSFNPRLPGGRRPSTSRTSRVGYSFNPRLPGGRRRSAPTAICSSAPFQSTPSGGKATLCYYPYRYKRAVSIHAFRGEGDSSILISRRSTVGFQSTPSGGKATFWCSGMMCRPAPFQSTPSGGKATRRSGWR